MLHIKLAQFAVRCALPPRRSESPICATDNKPFCVLHLLGWFIGSRGFSSLEQRPEFWVLHYEAMLLSAYRLEIVIYFCRLTFMIMKYPFLISTNASCLTVILCDSRIANHALFWLRLIYFLILYF